MECDACGFSHVLGPAPGVSAFVVDGAGSILLARRAHEPDKGRWDTLGGFLEEGEDPIDGLRRELREEAGVEVDVGAWVGAYADTYRESPDERHVLNLVWEARIVSGEPTPSDDVAELRWFPTGAVPEADELAFRWLGRCLRAWAASR